MVNLINHKTPQAGHSLYKYSIGHMAPSRKMLFFYAAKGRRGKAGVLSKLGVQQMGPCLLLVPRDSEKQFEDFLKKWDCPFTKRGMLVSS